MVAGGVGAAVRAARLKANPRNVYYGGSADATQAYREAYADKTDQGAATTQGGIAGLTAGADVASGISQRGAAVMDSAAGIRTPTLTRNGMSLLNAYQPGQVAAAQMKQATDATAQQNLSAGRVGGALGLRNALYGNAAMGQQNAQALAVQRAQEEQQQLAAKVAQENQDRATAFDQAQQTEQQRLATLQTGSQIAGAGNAQALAAAGNIGQLGLNTQSLNLSALQHTEDRAYQGALDYEQRRQAEKQRRQQNLWNLAGSLIVGGASVAAGGSAGYGGQSAGGMGQSESSSSMGGGGISYTGGGGGVPIGSADSYGVTNFGGRA